MDKGEMNYVLVDVRSPEEYGKEHIVGYQHSGLQRPQHLMFLLRPIKKKKKELSTHSKM